MSSRTKLSELNKYWFEFIEWAAKQKHRNNNNEYDYRTEKVPLSTYQAYDYEGAKERGPATRYMGGYTTYIPIVNEDNFWRWYTYHKLQLEKQ